MTDLIPRDDIPDDEEGLFDYLVGLVEQAGRVASAQLNATLTTRNWLIGRAIRLNILQQRRAEYGKQIVASLTQQLTARFGAGFDRTNVSRMMRFAEVYPQFDTIASLAHQLSWTHIRELLAVESPEAREFYVRQTVSKHLGVRALRQAIARRSYERRQIANAQIPEGSVVPRDTFTDPMILDLLGLHDSYSERDLEESVLHDMKDFLMEVGDGFTFVANQMRLPVSDKKSYRLDLLFFSRPLRRLVAVELKLGPFEAEYEGQMRGYLKWLDRYERKGGENSPLGLILCTGSDREEIELLELDKDGIVVVEYWTLLPPKAELEAKLRQIVRDAQERLARRAITEAEEDA